MVHHYGIDGSQENADKGDSDGTADQGWDEPEYELKAGGKAVSERGE